MTSELILGIRLEPQTLTTIKLNDINFKIKVGELKYETAKKVNLAKELFELIYCGSVLEDDMTLEFYGIKSGAMVHVLRKRESEMMSLPKYISEDSILQLASTFKSFKENPKLRSALNHLGERPEVINNIISSSPGLHEDTVAIAILQDPDLMAYFTDVDTVRRFAEAHPVLVEAAQNIAAAVHAEVHNNTTAGTNSSLSTLQPTAYLYSLDNLSDDEEMAGDSSQSSDSTQPSNISNNPSNSAITVAQLAAAVSRARARSFPLSNSPSSTSAGSTNSGVITTEMFTQAMQQASAATPGLINDTTLPPILPPVLPQFTDLQRQLAQMHELGLQDDTVNIQALHFTNGDVQAAIELVFNGFSNN
ncbi:ubiquitin-like protein 7 isoform X1 [Osmia bicornis bicornis]|uniref:ubiquitin-like protein 7 isoform X1 n=2 Tax=Osmia bicornis bicornis TaxID=1437191 RepID=UPI0010F9B637|nr:ubiquitin-like protein 7 isoform X1 [Osmia bicornis bicornis]